MSLKLNSNGGGSVTLQEPTTASNRTLNLPNVDGTVVTQDGSGNLLLTSGGGLGYGVGSGGTVTQATSKSTSVTINKPAGRITMNNAALAAGASVGFDVSNTSVSSSDAVVLTGFNDGVANPSNYRIEVSNLFNAGFGIRVTNISAGSLSQALNINFAVVKAATS